MNDSLKTAQESLKLLKDITSRDFLALGVHTVAYIKAIQLQNKTAYAIHAADGTPLSVVDDKAMAMDMILHNALEPVTVH